MLTNFWSLSLLSVFLWQKTSSSVIIVFLRPVFKDVNSWFCSVISFCKYVMATNKLDMMLVFYFLLCSLLFCQIPPCPQIVSLSIDHTISPHLTGEGPGLYFLYSSGCCYRVWHWLVRYFNLHLVANKQRTAPLDIFSSKLFCFLLLEAYEWGCHQSGADYDF